MGQAAGWVQHSTGCQVSLVGKVTLTHMEVGGISGKDIESACQLPRRTPGAGPRGAGAE